jgi:hypothetical protein
MENKSQGEKKYQVGKLKEKDERIYLKREARTRSGKRRTEMGRQKLKNSKRKLKRRGGKFSFIEGKEDHRAYGVEDKELKKEENK